MISLRPRDNSGGSTFTRSFADRFGRFIMDDLPVSTFSLIAFDPRSGVRQIIPEVQTVKGIRFGELVIVMPTESDD